MKKWLLSLGMLVFLVSAQNFEEYLQSEQKAFQAYKDALDAEFGEYLKQAWKPFEAQKPKPKLEPKPVVSPSIEPIIFVDKSPKAEDKPSKEDKPLPKPYQRITPVAPPKPAKEEKPFVQEPVVKKEMPAVIVKETPKPKPTPTVVMPQPVVTSENAKFSSKEISFYGQKLQLRYNNPLKNLYSSTLDQNKLTDAWEALATSEYVELLKQVDATIKTLNLNDWGRLKLLEAIGAKLFRNPNESKLFTWFVLTKAGYDIKVGYTPQKVVLLTPLNTFAYSTTYFTIGGKKYFAINYSHSKEKVGTIKTFEKSHPKSKEDFDLRITKQPNLKELKATREINFEIEGRAKKVTLEYDKVYVAYYKNYPQVEYENYFQAPVSRIADASIRNMITPLIVGKSEVEAVNLLLGLVQKGFAYKTDEGQFGHEKVMLPEETLFYPYSDCEDRAILFAKLVRDLLGLEVVGLKFPEHLATAVALKSTLDGATSFVRNGTRYYVADPTYIGASVGMMPPRYKNSKFTVIHVP